MKRTLALILTLAMLAALCACGGAAGSAAPAESAASVAASAEEAPAEAAAPAEEAPTEEAAPAEEEASVEEEAPVEEAEPINVIEYPLEGNPTFTYTVIMRNNVLAMLGDDDFSVTSAYRGLCEGTGANIEFNALGEATASEKINISLAGGDMTDFSVAIGTYAWNMTGAIEEGILFDFTPYLEDCAPNYKALLDNDEDIRAAATNPDGSVSLFVTQAAPVQDKGIVIRQDWLDDLGMEKPTNREDLEEVLKAFKTEKGASMPILTNTGLETGLAPSFNVVFAGLNGVNFQLTEPNGKEVIANFASENCIEYLLYCRHLYEEGLITDDFMSTGREQGNWETSYYSGKCGVWADGFRELDPANRANADDPNYRVAPMALTDYECHVSDVSTASMMGQVYLTAFCDDIENAMKVMNWCYTEEGIRNGLYGEEGEGYVIGDDGKVQLTENITNNPNGWSVNNALNFYGGQQWLPTCASMEYYSLICAPESYEGLEFWTEAYGDKAMKLPSAVALDSEDTTEFYSLASDVLTLFSESAIKVVTGQLDEAGYRQVIEDAKGMGLDRMTELYQAAYDDYLAG